MARARWCGIALVVGALALAAGCGTPTVGEPCSGSPQLGGCTEDAVCVLDADSPVGTSDDPVWDSYTCRATCVSHADCGAGFSCDPVPTTPTVYACIPRATP